MNRLMISNLTVAATALLCLGVAFSGAVIAQTAKEHVGTWTLVSTETVRPDGSRVPTFGGPATGILIFGTDGRFFYLFARAEPPKFAPNNPTTRNQEENAAVVK